MQKILADRAFNFPKMRRTRFFCIQTETPGGRLRKPMPVPSDKLYRKSAALLTAATIAFSSLARAAVPLPERDSTRAAILAPQNGDGPTDHEIRKFQAKIKEGRDVNAYLMRLGWAFVSKARISSDPGYYKLAEICAQSVTDADDSDALLLRGHIAHALHEFADTEAIAHKLTDAPHARWESFALLGDALMEQGKLEKAIAAYQRMIDIRPCLQTYARVAHVRWLKGDLDGAIELMERAVKASSTRDPEPAAWAYTRLGMYQLQAGRAKDAAWSAQRANEFVPDYPVALFLQAKLLANEQNFAPALAAMKRAIAAAPLPEYQWMLADVARAVGDDELATKTEAAIRSRGKAEDRRSLALFLATRNQSANEALELARQELEMRQDVFTYDAMAWAAFSAGILADAKSNIERALSEGTIDARLFYHAGKIAFASGDKEAAARWFARTMTIQQMLLPSERADLLPRVGSTQEKALTLSSIPTPNPQLADIGRK
jgi:tetratricopeptide (TPR) repeat protein